MTVTDLIVILVSVIAIACTWYQMGRRDVTSKLLGDYKEAAKLLGEQNAIITALKARVQELEERNEHGERTEE